MLHWGKTLAVASALGFTLVVGGTNAEAAPLGMTTDRPAQTDTLVVSVHGYARPRGRYDEFEPLPYYGPNSEIPRRPYHSRHYSPHHRPHYGSYYGSNYRPHYGSHYAPPVVYYESDRSINRRLRVGHPHDVARCAELFQSYNVYTGTYITYDGEVRMCPFID